MVPVTGRAPARTGEALHCDGSQTRADLPEGRRPGEHRGAKTIESRQLAAAAAHLADQKKASQIRVLDVSGNLRVADHFVLVCGLSRPHVRAIYNEIHVRLKAVGEGHGRAEGLDLGWWVLLDYGSVVVHIMQPEARDYYALDALYGDCEELDWRSVELPDLPEPGRARAS